MDHKQTIAFNGLNYVAAFRGAFSEANVKERVSIEHMETFFFIMTAHNQDSLELRRLQKALGYAQAKMHRTASVLETLGWIKTQDSAADARQKDVFLTDQGHAFFDKISKSLSENEHDSIFVKRSEDMRDGIEQDKAIREMRTVALPRTNQQSIENVALLAEQIKSGRPSVNATVMVEGVEAKGEVGRAKTEEELRAEIHENYHRAKIDEQLQKDAAIARAKARQDKHRAQLRDAIGVLEDGPIEVGANYVKTSRGIVTFAVLLRRINEFDPTLRARSINQIGLTIATMSEEDYDRLMTPSPKTKVARLEADLMTLRARIEDMERLGGMDDGPPHVQQETARLLRQHEVVKLELKSLHERERLSKFEKEYREDQAMMDAAIDAAAEEREDEQ